jgi:serine protease AprX
MNESFERIRKSVNWGGKVKYLNLVVALALVMTLAMPLAAPLAQLGARIQPLLVELAAQDPDQTVSVIVQKSVKDDRVEQAVGALGGTVTKDLHIINAFAAELKAKDVTQLARVNGVRWVSFDAPTQSAVTKFTTWATALGTIVPNGFTNAANILSPIGSNGTYGYGKNVKGAFTGFVPEYAPGHVISKVEVALRMYVSTSLTSSETPKITAYVNGKPGATVALATAALNGCVGLSKVCTQVVDITTSRTWKWSDFQTLQILVDQSLVSSKKTVYYDAIGVKLTTANGSDPTSPLVMSAWYDDAALNISSLSNAFNQAVRATDVWNTAPYVQGAGMTVAVVDSGSFKTAAIGSRLIGEVNFNTTEHNANDQYGHGTFVTGILADDGAVSGGKYFGIAPKVNVLGLRVSDDQGMSTESDVVSALQWVYDNKAAYNIKVVNLSLNSAVMQSYHTSPLDAAVEILWFNGIVVVVAAGNNGTAALYPPANDPFVITAGAVKDNGTVALTDDIVASFSAYGTDEAGQVKPDLVAPGVSLIGYLPDNSTLTIAQQHPEARVDNNYFRMSGTSMSAPIVSGAAALLLQDEPNLTPDQVKYRLKATANKAWAGYNATTAGAGYLDIYAAVNGTTTQSANTGLTASQLLWTGSDPVNWGSVQWGSVQWGSVQWGSVQWGSVQWGSVQWGSDYWGP